MVNETAAELIRLGQARLLNVDVTPVRQTHTTNLAEAFLRHATRQTVLGKEILRRSRAHL